MKLGKVREMYALNLPPPPPIPPDKHSCWQCPTGTFPSGGHEGSFLIKDHKSIHVPNALTK